MSLHLKRDSDDVPDPLDINIRIPEEKKIHISLPQTDTTDESSKMSVKTEKIAPTSSGKYFKDHIPICLDTSDHTYSGSKTVIRIPEEKKIHESLPHTDTTDESTKMTAKPEKIAPTTSGE